MEVVVGHSGNSYLLRPIVSLDRVSSSARLLFIRSPAFQAMSWPTQRCWRLRPHRRLAPKSTPVLSLVSAPASTFGVEQKGACLGRPRPRRHHGMCCAS